MKFLLFSLREYLVGIMLSNLGSKEILTLGGPVNSTLERPRIKSQKHPIDLENIEETIDR
jgi:hypothetical protein